MNTKNIFFCLLLIPQVLYSINDKTLERIAACINALQTNNIREFQNLLIENDFYIYHLFQPMHLPEITNFYVILYKHASQSELPIICTKFLEKLRDEVRNSISPSIRTKDDQDGWLWYRCYWAMNKRNIRKLHELLLDNNFYTSIESPISMRFGIFGDYTETNLIEMAICHGTTACLRLVCYLNSKKDPQEEVQQPGYLRTLYECWKKNKKLVSLTRLLITNKLADVNETNKKDGTTPLHHAPPQVVEFLIKNGADINKPDFDQITPVMRLASRHARKTKSLRCLLSYQPDLKKQDINGWTALHWALLSRQPIHIKMLLDCGADPSIKNNEGDTPVELIKKTLAYDPSDSNLQDAYFLLSNYPHLALLSTQLAIDPYKNRHLYAHPGFSHANAVSLIKNREITGKKHSYTKYKKVILMHSLKPQTFFKSSNNVYPISLVSIPSTLNDLKTGTRIAELD